LPACQTGGKDAKTPITSTTLIREKKKKKTPGIQQKPKSEKT